MRKKKETMKFKSLLLCLIACIFFAGCEDDTVLPSPSLQLKLTEEGTGNPCQKLTVLIYEDHDSWFNSINPVAVGLTNEEGVVIFNDLKETVYYFDIQISDEYTISWANYPEGAYRTQDALSVGTRSVVNITVHKEVLPK